MLIDNTATQVRSTAQAIVQDYCGPAKKMIDKRALYYAMVQALMEARQQGQQEMAQRPMAASGSRTSCKNFAGNKA